jgi:hypothetical protein
VFLDAEEKGELFFATWTSIVIAGHLISLLFLIVFALLRGPHTPSSLG